MKGLGRHCTLLAPWFHIERGLRRLVVSPWRSFVLLFVWDPTVVQGFTTSSSLTLRHTSRHTGVPTGATRIISRFMAATRLASASVSSRSSSDATAFVDISDDMWQEYRALMADIMVRDRVVKKAKVEDLPAVQEYLLLDAIGPRPLTSIATLDDENHLSHSRQVVKAEHRAFCEQRGWSRAQDEYLQRCLIYMGDWCAKKQLMAPALVTWLKIRESAFAPRENAVSTFLYIFGLQPHDPALSAAVADAATFHDYLYEPNEKTVYLRIKYLIADGEVAAAEDLAAAIPNFQRLRTFVPILSHYCEVEEDGIPRALRLFRRMRNTPSVHFDGETYVLLLAALARQGYFVGGRRVSTPVMEQAGFPATGPPLWDTLATEMADDLLELNETTATVLFESLRDSYGQTNDVLSDREESFEPSVIQNITTASSDSLTIGRVTVNPATGICPVAKTQLRLFALTESQQATVHSALLDMAAAQHEEFTDRLRSKGKLKEGVATNGTYALEQLAVFAEWLSTQNFTAILDGPNVAYYGHSGVHYSQVLLMVKHLESLGERPLVVMPQKYCRSTFFLSSTGRRQTLTEREVQAIADLQERGQLFVVPEYCLDDYYWMMASVAATAAPSQSNTSLPGLRPLLISNDQMRDHKWALLAPRLFRRWTSCHIVRYNFGLYDLDPWAEDRPVNLEPADVFSREIQGNPIPSSRGGTAWHIPVTEWTEEYPHDRLVIRLPEVG